MGLNKISDSVSLSLYFSMFYSGLSYRHKSCSCKQLIPTCQPTRQKLHWTPTWQLLCTACSVMHKYPSINALRAGSTLKIAGHIRPALVVPSNHSSSGIITKWGNFARGINLLLIPSGYMQILCALIYFKDTDERTENLDDS